MEASLERQHLSSPKRTCKKKCVSLALLHSSIESASGKQTLRLNLVLAIVVIFRLGIAKGFWFCAGFSRHILLESMEFGGVHGGLHELLWKL